MSPAREKSIEVTAEDAAAVAANASPSTTTSSTRASTTNGGNSSSSTSVKKRITKFIKPMGKNLQLRPTKTNNKPSGPSRPSSDEASSISSRPYYAAAIEADNSSFNSESIGQMSVTPTVASEATVKMSNRQAPFLLGGGDPRGHAHKGKKTTWKKLKKFMGLPPSNSKKVGEENPAASDTEGAPLRRTHSKSVDFVGNEPVPNGSNINGLRRRISSMDFPKASSKKQSYEVKKAQQRNLLDEAVRGRLDGIDMLYLGPAHLISLERPAGTGESKEISSTPWEPTPAFSFAGRSTQYTTQQIVTDMMWRSSGQEFPEIILEGFFRDDRWIVTLDMPKKKNNRSSASSGVSASGADGDILVEMGKVCGQNSPEPLPLLQSTDEEDHSHSTATDEIPRHKLWGSMWGADKPPPKPSHMTSKEDIDPNSDSILEMAASCSVPIDLDEDTFMIGNAHHLQAVHDLASVPLQHGHFEEAMEIFDRILRGIEGQETDALRHLEGVTLHNMAVVSMWQGKYEQALDKAGKAIQNRLQYLPEGHPDIAVSLVRQGFAYFALERFDLAEASFEAALDKLDRDSVVTAKVLSNVGVAKYQRGDDGGALKSFTNALEIQRMWLEGPVRREATVFGAAVLLGNMGKIHIKRGDYDLAVSVYEEALLLQTSIFRADNDIVLASLVSLALAWAFNAHPLKAGQILNGVLRSQLNLLGPGSTEVVETTGAIGNLHFGLGNYEDALKCFSPVLKWQQANLDPSHPALRKTKDIMKKIKRKTSAVWV